jgi:glutaredoxin
MKPIHHALIALTCTTAFSSLLVSPAKAAGACSVATRDKSNLSVYESPDEKSLINELRFGRKVDIKEAAKDSQGRTWVRIAGDYDGKYRQWGWVIRRYLECENNQSSVITVYGRQTCPRTTNLMKELSQRGIPYKFKDADTTSGNQEMWSRIRSANLNLPNSFMFPVVHISNRRQSVMLTSNASQVIEEFKSKK